MILIASGLFLLALTPALTASIHNSCPVSVVQLIGNEKFFRVQSQQCFLFVNYDKVVFEDAREKCQNSGGTLAMPKTKKVNDFLIQEMKKYFGNSPLWIGMHDTVEEGNMIWEDGTDVQDWGNFDQGNGGLFGGGEDCVALDPRNEKWHDYGCFQQGFFAQNSKLGFICEYSKMKDNGDDTNVDDGTTGQGGQNDITGARTGGHDNNTGAVTGGQDDNTGAGTGGKNDTIGAGTGGQDNNTGAGAGGQNDITGARTGGHDNNTGAVTGGRDDNTGAGTRGKNDTIGAGTGGQNDTRGAVTGGQDDNTGAGAGGQNDITGAGMGVPDVNTNNTSAVNDTIDAGSGNQNETTGTSSG